jgi:hypothetical protein
LTSSQSAATCVMSGRPPCSSSECTLSSHRAQEDRRDWREERPGILVVKINRHNVGREDKGRVGWQGKEVVWQCMGEIEVMR